MQFQANSQNILEVKTCARVLVLGQDAAAMTTIPTAKLFLQLNE